MFLLTPQTFRQTILHLQAKNVTENSVLMSLSPSATKDEVLFKTTFFFPPHDIFWPDAEAVPGLPCLIALPRDKQLGLPLRKEKNKTKQNLSFHVGAPTRAERVSFHQPAHPQGWSCKG